MKRLSALLAAASIFFIFGALTVGAAPGISVSEASLKLNFPKDMTFHLAAKSASNITSASLAVHFATTDATTRIQANFTPAAQLDTSVVWNLGSNSSSAVGGYLVPGAGGDYTWHIVDADGATLDTPPEPFRVVDNRVTWKELKNDRVAIYWYSGDDNFGQSVFSRANKTLDTIENDIGAKVDRQIQIWMYGDQDTFRSALPPGQPEWVGGQSFNDFSVVLVLASGDNLDYAMRGALHEMTHQVIAQAMKGPFQSALPHWMDEGLAVYHQFDPPHLDDFLQPPLQRAIQEDTLFHLKTLESNFPANPDQADVAYGESYGVVAYMLKQYGPDKMKQIFSMLKSGATADEAFQQVLGVDTDGLENEWRKSIGAQPKNYVKEPTATPGLVPTLSLSSADTPSAATATPAAVALQETPTVTSGGAPTPQTSGGPAGGGGGLCGGLFGGVGLVAFGVMWTKRRK
jgi:Peptidase MA superfamily